MTSATVPYSHALISRLFPEALPTVEQLEAKYPPRNLPEGAKVLRAPPSPTGFVHLGNVSTFLINERIAHQSGGLFYLRIEDTDQKREVEGATELIVRTMERYGIHFDEGVTGKNSEKGPYAPYTQSQRADIYKAYIKKLLTEGKAYPCFVTSAELDELRQQQEHENLRPGYYGKYALHRNLTETEITERLDKGEPFVIRFRSNGNYDKMREVTDLVKGELRLPENDTDIVIWKTEGLPTYHFAHAVDDHLMGTTHVIRGEEWLSSVPLHLELFYALGWKAPKYGHLSHLQKLDNGNRRKFSKRLDPEFGAAYYEQKGYHPVAVIEYLLNLANSNFEDWRRANPAKPYQEFQFSLKKLGTTGALFDFVKLDSIAKDVVARFSAEEIYNFAHTWAQKHSPETLALLERDASYVKAILNIERTGAKIRKDITTWSDISHEIEYFFDDKFALTKETALSLIAPVSAADAASAAKALCQSYNPSEDKDTWFNNVKKIAESLGYTSDTKAYKANPSAFKGTVSDIAKVFRVLLTGRAQTPDLHSVMAVMGKERCLKRLNILG